MTPYIVADIGGTNARFALVTGKSDNKFEFENIEIFNGAEFDSFDEAMSSYLTGLGTVRPKAACIAIAGPIDGDNVKMTNLDWSFSQEAMRKHFDFDVFSAINDFGALAVATSRLGSDDVDVIKQGTIIATGNKVVLGPGTGLGAAGLVYSGAKWVPVASEGGHVNIAPSTPLECDIVKAGMSQHKYVSAETFISGRGLVNLYDALCLVKGIEAQSYGPKDISGNALDKSDQNCIETLDLFCGFIGSTASNLALSYGAHGGVYLGGGVLPRVADFLKQSSFTEKFSQKGVMSHYVEPIPVNLIAYKQTAFLGAAAWLEQLLYGNTVAKK